MGGPRKVDFPWKVDFPRSEMIVIEWQKRTSPHLLIDGCYVVQLPARGCVYTILYQRRGVPNVRINGCIVKVEKIHA